MRYQRVLVAVDLTEEAEEVLGAARDFLASAGAGVSVDVLTVVRPLARVYGGLDMAPMAASALAFEDEAVKQTTGQLKTLVADFGIDAERAHVRVGSPSMEIKAFAAEQDTQLIIMGTHGRQGLGLLLGSTANAVLHGVPCDVLAISIKSMEVS
ncbi:MAG: universal stress protein [Pseudomonadota bacterium]